MIGIVIVSHSAKLAEGVVELARNMGGEDVLIQAAGGLSADGNALGTDPMLILNAIEKVYSEDGVLVLMDLGSAVLSSEMALELLPEEKREKVVLCEAPLVEGAVAAAVQARIGSPLGQVLAEARSALSPKITHLGSEAEASPARPASADGDHIKLQITVNNRLGLHARPAARFVSTAGKFPQETILISNLTTGRGPCNAKSINSVITLGVRQGHEIQVTAEGPNARAALDAIRALADDNFGDPETDSPVPSNTPTKGRDSGEEANVLSGVPASAGVALGPVHLYRPAPPEIPQDGAGDPEQEWKDLLKGIAGAQAEIELDRRSALKRAGEDTAEIFDAHLMFLEDQALLEPARERIFKNEQNAAVAWQAAIDRMSAEFRRLEDPYLQARGKDVEDVGRQVLLHLLGIDPAGIVMEKPGILIAADLTPAQTSRLDPATVLGICTAQGGPTSHSAILARGLGIPAVVGVGDRILELDEGGRLILDGDSGKVFIDPAAELINEYSAKAEANRNARASARQASSTPALTLDGKRIEIAANIGSVAEAQLAVESGAEGVGLFRTEFLFLERTTAPDESEQYEVYRAAARALEGRPFIIRTMDIGGDKSIPYLNVQPEANPFLGWRAIRISLAQPELFKAQLRAILRVAVEFPVKVMFPMIATLDELRRAKALLTEAQEELGLSGDPRLEKLETGIMVEIPSVAQMADAFAKEVDFFSIGTNDLTQYTFAADRTNPLLSALADACHPGVLRQIRNVIEAAHHRGLWVGVCGELAGDVEAIPLLLGLGVDELSMSHPSIPAAKEIVRSLSTSQAGSLAEQALELESAEAVRALVRRVQQ